MLISNNENDDDAEYSSKKSNSFKKKSINSLNIKHYNKSKNYTIICNYFC